MNEIDAILQNPRSFGTPHGEFYEYCKKFKLALTLYAVQFNPCDFCHFCTLCENFEKASRERSVDLVDRYVAALARAGALSADRHTSSKLD